MSGWFPTLDLKAQTGIRTRAIRGEELTAETHQLLDAISKSAASAPVFLPVPPNERGELRLPPTSQSVP